jgi:uncharacterized protein (TIGR01244 family)
MQRVILSLAIALISALIATAQSQVRKDAVPGITNLARIETTVACAGAIKPEAVADIKKMGFASIINLREASEPGANVEAEEAAAKAAAIKYAHIPFSNASPSPAAVDRFLQVITQPGQEPAFIHCAGGGRAATMWFIKRVLVDKWDTDRAMAEATQLGLSNERAKTFALGYIESHKK